MTQPRGSRPGERRGGRKAGTPNRSCVLTRERVEGLVDPVAIMAAVAKGEVIEAAPNKDAPDVQPEKVRPTLDQRLTAARWLGDRVAPVPKTPPFRLDLPDIKTAADLPAAMLKVIQAAAAGNITLEQGQGLAALIEAHRKTIETADLEMRLKQLEESVR